jgi:NADPH:quinone reductase-like Zn-dependent oxidoreductase
VLAPGGSIVRYASASGQGVDQNAPAITRKGIKVEFVFPPRFDFETKIAPVIAEAVPLVESGALYVNVDASLAFSHFPQALRLLHHGRKVLLHPGSTRRSWSPAGGD